MLLTPARPIPRGWLVVSGTSTGIIAGDRAIGRAGINCAVSNLALGVGVCLVYPYFKAEAVFRTQVPRIETALGDYLHLQIERVAQGDGQRVRHVGRLGELRQL